MVLAFTNNESWRRQANCRGCTWWPWPAESRGGKGALQQRDAIQAAIDVCHECAVLDECAAYVMGLRRAGVSIVGVWNGVNYQRPHGDRPCPRCGQHNDTPKGKYCSSCAPIAHAEARHRADQRKLERQRGARTA
jgi:hypothetical protein